MRNPFSRWSPSGSWERHATYSAGGTDFPCPWGTWLVAPASGVLESVRYQPSWSAGRVVVFRLDEPVHRVVPASGTRMIGGRTEAVGPMVRVVVQHAANERYPVGRRFSGGETGWCRTGDSGPGEHGADVHAHVHGLDAAGNRVDFTKFLGVSPSGGTGTPINESRKRKSMIQLRVPNGTIATIGEFTAAVYTSTAQAFHYDLAAQMWGVLEVTPDQMTTAINVALANREQLTRDIGGGLTVDGESVPFDAAEVARLVEAGLADDFAAIPDAVNDEADKRARERLA